MKAGAGKPDRTGRSAPYLPRQDDGGPVRAKRNTQDRQYWSGLSAQSRLLMRMSVALLFVMTIAIAGTIWHMRTNAVRAAGLNITKLGIAISEQTTRAVQATDLVLEGMRLRAANVGVTTPEAFQALFATQAVFHDLQRQTGELPQAGAFTVVSNNGAIINSSRQWPPHKVNLADRDYFKYFQTHNDLGVYISQPISSRSDGALTSYLVRRVNGPNGEFLGLVLGSLDLKYFQSFYRLISADETSVCLSRNDGTMLTRYPPLDAIEYKIPETSAWYDHVATGRNVYTAPGIEGGSSQLVFAQALADYPLVVSVGLSWSRILESWRNEAILISFGALCAVLCVIVLLRALTMQLHRLERSEAFLVTQNETLQQAQERMRVQTAVLSFNQTELAQKTAALETTLETMDQGLLTVSRDGRIEIYNRRLLELLDLPDEFLASRPYFSDLLAFQRKAGEFDVAGQALPSFIASGLVSDQPYRYERQRANGKALEIHSIPLAGGGMVRTFTDITERRRSEEQLRYFARHDSLTKLVNRVVFQERLQQALDTAGRTGRLVAVLCLDLDRFKLVNDTQGHAAGDQLLTEVSMRLQSAVRDTDTVARMGGDEFAVVQPMIDRPEDAEKLALRLLDLIARPYEIDGRTALIGVSIGIAFYPAHGVTAGQLLGSADTALYRAKADGRGIFRLFDQSMEAAQRDVFQMEQDLRNALDRNELHLAYQPIVDSSTRTVLAFEALLRWTHPLRGPINPAEFIPLAEMSGSILPIGLWVLETACAEAASWLNPIRVSVNLSPLQFRQGDLVSLIKNILLRTGLPADRLTLEVTEGLLLDGTRQVLGMMEDLRALGVRFSLDDFGTAHAGLSYLRCFPFDAIKIDKSFVQDALTRPESRAIVKTILVMGNVLKLNVIAEGVETEDQLKLLLQLRCRQVQGFLTGRPMPARAVREFISTLEDTREVYRLEPARA